MNSAKLKETIANIVKEESEYQVFFRKALEKAGKSITDMSDEEKKEFFNKIDAAWDGKGEKNEELTGNQHKLDVDGDGEIEASDLAALRAGETKEESVTESTINESPSSEEIRIAMLAVNKQKKYRRVTTSAAVNDLMNSLEVIARDIKNGKIKDESVNEAKVGDFEMGDFVHFKSANKTGMVKKISGDKVTIMTMKGDFTGDINDIQVLYQDNVNPSVNEEKYTVIDPRGNSLGTADKTQVAMAAKKKGGEKAGYFVVSAKNALKARRALEKFKGDFKNPKLKDMMANLYYESVNESVESVITEQLVPVDKKAVDAFFDKKGFEGKNLNSDGKVLKTVGIGSQEMYIHTPKGVKFVGKVTGKYAQSVVQYVNKNHKSDLSETITEGRAFINAARKAKEEGKTEFEFNGKKYPVTIK